MFVINDIDYTIIVMGIAVLLLFFAIQLILCVKTRKVAVKICPIFFIFLMFLFSITLYAGIWGYGKGFIPSNNLIALIIAAGAGIASIGEMFAWLVYLIYRRKSQNNSKK